MASGIWTYGYMEWVDWFQQTDSAGRLFKEVKPCKSGHSLGGQTNWHMPYTAALKEKLDPSRKALETQDFCHLAQGRNEGVADFIL